MSGNDLTLKPFHPLIRQWFTSRVGTPTGSGKTLAAFLVAIDRLVSGEWEEGGIRVLYVSPLKVLNNDVQRNLITPLDEIRENFCPGWGTISRDSRSHTQW